MRKGSGGETVRRKEKKNVYTSHQWIERKKRKKNRLGFFWWCWFIFPPYFHLTVFWEHIIYNRIKDHVEHRTENRENSKINKKNKNQTTHLRGREKKIEIETIEFQMVTKAHTWGRYLKKIGKRKTRGRLWNIVVV